MPAFQLLCELGQVVELLGLEYLQFHFHPVLDGTVQFCIMHGLVPSVNWVIRLLQRELLL